MEESCRACKQCYASSDVLGEEYGCRKEGDLSPEQFERAEEIEWDLEKMPAICGMYEVVPASCGICGEDLGAHQQWRDDHPDLWAWSLYGDPYPVCSLACKAIAEAREEEIVDQADLLSDWSEPDPASLEPVYDYVADDFAFDAYRELQGGRVR